MEHRYVTNHHHAITFRWEFQLLLIFQDDYVSCRSIDIHYSITIGNIGAPSCPSQGIDPRKQDDGSRHERFACDIILPPIGNKSTRSKIWLLEHSDREHLFSEKDTSRHESQWIYFAHPSLSYPSTRSKPSNDRASLEGELYRVNEYFTADSRSHARGRSRRSRRGHLSGGGIGEPGGEHSRAVRQGFAIAGGREQVVHARQVTPRAGHANLASSLRHRRRIQ